MNIAELVLHPSAQAQLDELLAAPSHAVLLSGPLGTGKTHIAREVAIQLLGVTGKTVENQPYFREVVPVKDSIAIEQVRILIKFFRLTVPGKARIKRVAVIQDADTMGREAQNALLKLLEEPPEGSVLILTSSRPEQLLSTIRSRVQTLALASPEPTALTAHFGRLGYDKAAVARVLLRSGTNAAAARRLLEGESGGPDDASLSLVKQALSGTTYDRMLLVDALAKQKEQAATFVTTLAAAASASLQAAAAKGTDNLARWHAVLQAAACAQDALDRNGNAKLVLTELMLAL